MKEHVESLIQKAAATQDSAEAMRFTQAALNAANARWTVLNADREFGQKA